MPKESFDQIKETANEIEGWLEDNEGKLLYDYAKKCKGHGVIVEIGSWKGKSSIYLAKGAINGNNPEIYTIDPHITSTGEPNGSLEDYKKNMEKAGLSGKITHIVEKSEDAVKNFNKPVEFIFIDGFHQYESVKLDFEEWSKWVIDDGFIALHDVRSWLGPKQLAREIDRDYDNYRFIEYIDETLLIQKIRKKNSFDEEKNKDILKLF